jgi:hypothetical protein
VTPKEVISMRALVVYESMYGNTQLVANRIADGLRPRFEATVVPVAQATRELLDAADLLIVGGPTHMHRMSTMATRHMAVTTAAKNGSGLATNPGADGPGAREWLNGIGAGNGNRLVAAFDTRLDGLPALTGHASHGISRLLIKHGYRLIVVPQSFLVNKQNVLLDGEQARARQWGSTVAGLVSLQMSAA